MVAENKRFCRTAGKMRNDLIDIILKTHIEHAIGFV